MTLAPFRPSPASAIGESQRRRLALIAAFVGIFAALLAYAISPTVRHAVKHAAGSVRHAVARVFRDEDRKRAPALTGQVLIGPRVQLSALRGHPAVIVFWSGSCAGCSSQAAAVAQFASGRYGRAQTLGVYSGGARAAGESFIARHRWTFPNLLDQDGRLAKRYGIKVPARELPVTFVLDASGNIRATLHGPQSYGALTRAVSRAH